MNALAATMSVGRLSRSALFAAGAAGLALTTAASSGGPFDGSPSTPDAPAGDAEPADAGPDGAMVPPTDASEGGD